VVASRSAVDCSESKFWRTEDERTMPDILFDPSGCYTLHDTLILRRRAHCSSACYLSLIPPLRTNPETNDRRQAVIAERLSPRRRGSNCCSTTTSTSGRSFGRGDRKITGYQAASAARIILASSARPRCPLRCRPRQATERAL
jgi:hypothetical protein